MKFLRIILATLIGYWIAGELIPGFVIPTQIIDILIGGVILGILFAIVRPILKIISFPAILLTAGLFIIVINGFLIWGLAYFTSYASVNSFLPLLWTTLLISAVVYISRGFEK